MCSAIQADGRDWFGRSDNGGRLDQMTLTATSFFSADPGSISPRAEDRFFGAIRNRNRTFKFTGTARLSALDEALVRQLEARDLRAGEVLDIGMSSGVTTLELANCLRRAGHDAIVTGTDLTLRAYIVPVAPGCRALVDANGHVLQYEVAGRALNPWGRRLDYFNGMVAVRALADRLLAPRARRAMNAGQGIRQVALVSPRLSGRADIGALEDNVMILNPRFLGRFPVVRAANILNLSYFPEAALNTALRNVAAYLSGPGALLLVVRSVPGMGNHGSLFEVSPDGARLILVERYGNGSEVEHLVLATRRAAGMAGETSHG